MLDPSNIKVNMTTGLKKFVGKTLNKDVTFMGDKLKISKLTLAQVESIQEFAKLQEGADNTKDQLAVVKHIITLGAEGGGELSNEEFKALPLQDLSQLAEEIMKFAGVSGDEGKVS